MEAIRKSREIKTHLSKSGTTRDGRETLSLKCCGLIAVELRLARNSQQLGRLEVMSGKTFFGQKLEIGLEPLSLKIIYAKLKIGSLMTSCMEYPACLFVRFAARCWVFYYFWLCIKSISVSITRRPCEILMGWIVRKFYERWNCRSFPRVSVRLTEY